MNTLSSLATSFSAAAVVALLAVPPVAAQDTAPTFGSATVSGKAWTVNVEIDPLRLPAATGGNGTLTYSLSPMLPTGLTFSATTRQITGTPTATHERATYTYMATDSDTVNPDSDELTFDIGVFPALPGLRVVPVDGATDKLDVSWNTFAGAFLYDISWRTENQSYDYVGRNWVALEDETTYQIDGLAPNTVYVVQVFAQDIDYAYLAMSEATGTTNAPTVTITDGGTGGGDTDGDTGGGDADGDTEGSTIAPTAPQFFRAIARNGSVLLSWQDADDHGGPAISHYAYRYRAGNEPFGPWHDIPESAPGEANANGYAIPDTLAGGMLYTFRLRAVNRVGTHGDFALAAVFLLSSTSTEDTELPDEVMLLANWPNPFTALTRIQYVLPSPVHVRLAVYDVQGRRVRILENDLQPAGSHTAVFDAADLPGGIYVYRLETPDRIISKVMALVK